MPTFMKSHKIYGLAPILVLALSYSLATPYQADAQTAQRRPVNPNRGLPAGSGGNVNLPRGGTPNLPRGGTPNFGSGTYIGPGTSNGGRGTGTNPYGGTSTGNRSGGTSTNTGNRPIGGSTTGTGPGRINNPNLLGGTGRPNTPGGTTGTGTFGGTGAPNRTVSPGFGNPNSGNVGRPVQRTGNGNHRPPAR